jgi:drug/metabolite transporter (DMT)-like permease
VGTTDRARSPLRARDIAMLTTVVLLWGSSFVFVKVGLGEVPPITLALLRFSLVLPVFVVATFAGRWGSFKTLARANWKAFALLGLAGVTSYHAFQNIGLNFTTASNSSLIIASNPLLIVLLDRFFHKTNLSGKQKIGVIAAFVGILMVILKGGSLRLSTDPYGLVGDVLSFGAALSWAFYSVYGKGILSNLRASEVTAYSLLFGALFLSPLALILEKPILPTTWVAWSMLLILSFLSSGLAYYLWYKALESTSASNAGAFLFVIPVVTVLVASLTLGEALDALFAAGAAITILGVALAERG